MVSTLTTCPRAHLTHAIVNRLNAAQVIFDVAVVFPQCQFFSGWHIFQKLLVFIFVGSHPIGALLWIHSFNVVVKFGCIAVGVYNQFKIVPPQGVAVNLAPPWRRYTMAEALVEVAGLDPAVVGDDDAVLALAREKGIELQPGAGPGKARTELFELLVEERLIDPTFITSYPTEVSPLARRNEEDPAVTDRFELFITGREIANAFSELNDPIDQLQRFQRQIDERGDDDEIHPVLDRDYVRALEYGMPAAAGEGIGIDRLVMLLTDAPSIRDVILFPQLKRETGE